MRIWLAAVWLAAMGIGSCGQATAGVSLGDVMARLDRLEQENAILRARVDELERQRASEALPADEATPAVMAAYAPVTNATWDAPSSGDSGKKGAGFAGVYAGLSGEVRASEMLYNTVGLAGVFLRSPDQPVDGAFGAFVGANHVSDSMLVGVEAGGYAGIGEAVSKTKPGRPSSCCVGVHGLPQAIPGRSYTLQRQGGFNVAARGGAVIADDLLLFGKVGAGIDFMQARYKCTQPEGTDPPFVFGCGRRSGRSSAAMPYALIGLGVEKNFGRMFVRGEAELQAYLGTWPANGPPNQFPMPQSAYVPSAKFGAGVRF